jgi:hypothetical protein
MPLEGQGPDHRWAGNLKRFWSRLSLFCSRAFADDILTRAKIIFCNRVRYFSMMRRQK